MKQDILRALKDWNPWLQGHFPNELSGIERQYHVMDYLQVPEIKIIEGARRVGKSTLMYQIIEKLLSQQKSLVYINFEDEILKQYDLEVIIHTFLEQHPIQYLLIDEIQNCKEWVSYVRKIYDRKEYIQIWISGSNSNFIKQEYASLLTGRNLPLKVYPLSFREFLRFKDFKGTLGGLSTSEVIQVKGFFNEYLEMGGFPAVASRQLLKKELLLSYFDDFIYKDIVARFQVNPDKLKTLALYLATNTAKIFSYRTLASLLNCHVDTVIDYIHHLKEVFLFSELHKFDYSLKKQHGHDKKIYCIDTGIAAAVSFRFSSDLGRMLENLVYCELQRRQKTVYFYKDKFECDFLIKEALEITEAIQVCVSLDNPETRAREIRGLLSALKTHQLSEGFILTLDATPKKEMMLLEGVEYHIKICSVWEWLL